MNFRSFWSFLLFLIFFLIQGDSFSKKITHNKTEIHYFTIAAGPCSGTYFPVASYVSGLLTTPPGSPPCEKGGSCGVSDLVSIAYATDGSFRNLALLEEGKVSSAFVQSDSIENKLNTKIISPLFPEFLHIIIPSKSTIYKLSDLKGKMISLGKTHSGSYRTIKRLLTLMNLKPNEYRFSHDDPAHGCDLLEQGQVDAVIMIAGNPIQCVMNLAKKMSLRFVGVDPDDFTGLNKKGMHFKKSEITPGIYWNIGRIKTISVQAFWVTTDEANEKNIYDVTKAFWRNQNQNKLRLSFPNLKLASFEEISSLDPADLHKGAYRFYKEMGLFPPEK